MATNWRQKEECQPFEDTDGNICIVVNSAYESPGTDKDNRLEETKRDGIDKLLRFYGKLPVVITRDINAETVAVNRGLGFEAAATEGAEGISEEYYDSATVADYFVSYKPCVPMKVLVKISKELFDSIPDDTASCSIDKPAEGYFEARLSIYDYSEKITFIVENLEAYLPNLARSSKFISNVNVLAEIKRLKQTINVIDRYMKLNKIQNTQGLYDPCIDEDPSEGADEEVSPPYSAPDKKLIIGYTFNYKVAFALIDDEQHTIGYDCFIENTILNHLTTANFLINLDSIYDFLKSSATLDIFDFFLRFLLPTPIIKTKQNQNDGLPLYDENGVSFGFADLAKLLSLELDMNLCKTPEQLAEENNKLLNAETRKALRDSANKLTKFKGDMKLSSEGMQNLKNKMQNAVTGEDALTMVYNDVLSKVNIACTVQEALQCYVDRTIELVGEQIIADDSDLGQVIDLSFSLGAIVDALCGFQRCDGSPDIDFSIGFPIFQGIQIPENFPTLDYLAEVIAEALDKLYAALVGALVSAILNILNNSCSLLFDDILGEGSATNSIKSGFQDWLGESIGINYEDLNDPEAWGAALTSSGGTGFLGAIGNMVSAAVDSGHAAYEDTGISFNLPNPQDGWNVEEVFISPETLNQFLSDLQSATQDVNALTSPREQVSLFKGSASDETIKLAFGCLKLRNPDFSNFFEDEYQFADMFAELGKLVKPEFLQSPPAAEKVPPRNFCELGDGSEARLLREAILSEKDVNMSQEEINIIIDKEIEYNTEKIKNLAEMLGQILNGSLAPTFPSILGGEDSLIPKTPDIIDEMIRTAAAGAFGTAINNFNVSSADYSSMWNYLNSDAATTISPADDIYRYFGESSGTPSAYEETSEGDDKVGNYNYGYYLDTGGGGVQAASGDPGAPATGYTENVLIRSFDGNFKEKNIQDDIVEAFGADGLVTAWVDADETIPLSLSPVYEQIIDFIEAKDDSGDEEINVALFYDPHNTLISYSVITYREGGWGSIFTDLYEVTIVQTVYDSADQPVIDVVSGDYGGIFGTTDKSNLRDNLEAKFPELSTNRDMRDAIVAYISDDMDEFQAIMATGVTAGTVAIFAVPLAVALSSSAIFGTVAAFYIAMLGGPILWAAAVLVALIVFFWNLWDEPPPVAQRMHAPAGDGSGEAFTYDLVRDFPEPGKYSITKRQIPVELLLTSGARPETWPTKIVSLQKDPGMQIGSLEDLTSLRTSLYLQDRTLVNEYHQYYSIGTLTDDFALRDASEGLSLVSYNYSNDDYMYRKALMQGATSYSYAARDFGNLVASSLGDYFTSDSDKDIIDQIAIEVKERYSGGNALTNLQGQLITQLRLYILSNRFWETDGFGDKTLSYPATDIFKYEELNTNLQEFSSNVLQLQNANTYCDSLSANRRANVTYATILLIRAFIVEQAIISIQVLDSLDPTIMGTDLFTEHVYNLIQKDTDLYRVSFDIENRIFTDLVNNTAVYYEIRQLLGEEVPAFDKTKDYLKQLIREQIEILSPQIGRSMGLANSASSWERFLATKLFGDFDATLHTSSTEGIPTTINSGVATSKGGPGGEYGVEYELRGKGYVQDGPGGADIGPFELYGENWTGRSVWIDPPQQGLSSEAATVTWPHHMGEGEDGYPLGLKGFFPDFPDELVTDINSIWDPWMETHVPVASDATGRLYYGAEVPATAQGYDRDSTKSGTITKTIGNEDWTVEYAFEIEGGVYPEDASTGTNYTKYKIQLNIGSLNQTDMPYVQAESILTPFEGYSFIGTTQSATDLPDGFIFERYVKVKRKDAEYETFGPQAFFDYVGDLPSSSLIFDEYDYINFGYRLIYVADNSAEHSPPEDQNIRDLFLQLDPGLPQPPGTPTFHPRSFQEKAFIMNSQAKVVNGYLRTYDAPAEDEEGENVLVEGVAPAYYYVGIPLVSFECEYTPQIGSTALAAVPGIRANPTFGEFLTEMDSRYESGIYLSLRTELLATEEFKRIFNLLIPLQEICAGFMMYQYNALSDETIFPANREPENLYNIMSRSKVSILQIFESAIYGNGKVIYNDPFTQKAGSELV